MLEETPYTFLSSETTYDTDLGLAAGAVGLYDEFSYAYSSQLRDIYGLLHYGTDLSQAGTNAESKGTTLATFDSDYNSEFSPFEKTWNHYYRLANKAVTIIDRGDAHQWDDPDLKETTMGEAYFFRAYAHFMLKSLWGEIPLITNEILSVKLDFQKNSMEEINSLIVEDLEKASMYLPAIESQSGRLTKGAAQHLLAYAYLSNEQWDMAETYADSVIAGDYALMTERYGDYAADTSGSVFTDLFEDGNYNTSSGNTEAIWVLQVEDIVTYPFAASSINDYGMNYTRRFWYSRYDKISGLTSCEEYGGRGFNRCSCSDYFLGLFEDDDIRGQEAALRRTWTYIDEDILPAGKSLGDTVSGSGTIDYLRAHPTKFDCYNDAQSSSYKDVYLFRLAETYLIKAEAQYRLNEDAASTINILRDRANASLVSNADVDIDFILDERARELWGEAPRRIDLVRTDRFLDRVRDLTGESPLDYHVLFPIPQSAIDLNTDAVIEQNDGY
jgi:hypothetical protein